MKKGVIFINTVGKVVNTEDLIDALKRKCSCCRFDVYENEKKYSSATSSTKKY
jgi:lactate dehydrogenase-like 2-hydroxyacid dehydrogenase